MLDRVTRHLRILMALACLVVHLATVRGYGYFRDELYALACSSRLAWGYVDRPPLSIALLRLIRSTLGDSLPALRLLPALAGAATVFLTGALCRRMGGGTRAQILAMLSALVAPVYLFQRHVYGVNVLDVLFWTLAAVVLARLFVTGERHLWIVLGVVLGLGLLNKLSVLWLGFGLAIGLRFSRHRGWYMTPWPWAAGAISFALFAPHLAWQVSHAWPTLRLIGNVAAARAAARETWVLVVRQIVEMNPVTVLVWGAGLVFLLLPGEGRRFRPFAWVYLSVLALLTALPSSRPSDLAPAYPPLLAAGGVALERWSSRPHRRFLAPTAQALVALGGLALAPAALPLLPIDAYLHHARILGVGVADDTRHEIGALPQHYADMFGWEAIVAALARARDALPAPDRARAELYVENYGEAGAIERFGPTFGLPRASCAHDSYWFFGPEPSSTGEVVIVLGGSESDWKDRCASLTEVGRTACGLCMPYENDLPIRLCRGLHPSMAQLWPRLRRLD